MKVLLDTKYDTRKMLEPISDDVTATPDGKYNKRSKAHTSGQDLLGTTEKIQQLACI
ncbi:unnamed protein product [Ixodes pacificus]